MCASFIQRASAARFSVENINFRCWGVRKKTGVLSAFVGTGLICRVSLSSHLLDSISSSVTSADYVSSKQPATWRRTSAIIVREWQLANTKTGWRKKKTRVDVKKAGKIGKQKWWDTTVMAYMRVWIVNAGHANKGALIFWCYRLLLINFL